MGVPIFTRGLAGTFGGDRPPARGNGLWASSTRSGKWVRGTYSAQTDRERELMIRGGPAVLFRATPQRVIAQTSSRLTTPEQVRTNKHKRSTKSPMKTQSALLVAAVLCQ